ncbi:MAG TPA: ester cyclase, partial [Acidimicrobiales bacterium]|nr:ester cyclase [Acidimicrobiales bacterium]
CIGRSPDFRFGGPGADDAGVERAALRREGTDMPQAQAERNKETVRRMFDEVINLGKLDLINELFASDFHTTTPEGRLDRDGFRDFVAGWRSGFSDLRCEVSDLVAEGDRVAWAVQATGVHTGQFSGIPPTGRSVDFASLNIATFRDGRALEHKVIMDAMTMLIQLGVMPAPSVGSTGVS